ncbi:hypothetical protein Efla_000468 [Eimeria flavescens]
MRITVDLIRRKSEHNDDTMEQLEEIALHQLEIEKIELIDRLCKDLKILLLQNNLIERLENLGRLKRLEYLNVALNNIVLIENVDRCESLKKLDLTVNFIELGTLERSLDNLRGNECLEELYLMGNPCTEWGGYRAFTIAKLAQLKQLDGKAINPLERIEAFRSLPRLAEDLKHEISRRAQMPANTTHDAYTRESRKRMYLEMAQVAVLADNACFCLNEVLCAHMKVFETYNSKGEIRQCNEGKVPFKLDSHCEPGQIVASFQLPKHLSTLLIDVDVQPTYLRVTVKGKVTQLRLPEEVSPDTSTVKRSQSSGELRICMPVANWKEGIGAAAKAYKYYDGNSSSGWGKDTKKLAKPKREYLELQLDEDKLKLTDAPLLEDLGDFIRAWNIPACHQRPQNLAYRIALQSWLIPEPCSSLPSQANYDRDSLQASRLRPEAQVEDPISSDLSIKPEVRP